MSKPANPYQLFLGSDVDPKKPDFGQLLGFDFDQATPSEIQLAFDNAIAKVQTQEPGDHAKLKDWLIDQLIRAKKELGGVSSRQAVEPKPASSKPAGKTVTTQSKQKTVEKKAGSTPAGKAKSARPTKAILNKPPSKDPNPAKSNQPNAQKAQKLQGTNKNPVSTSPSSSALPPTAKKKSPLTSPQSTAAATSSRSKSDPRTKAGASKKQADRRVPPSKRGKKSDAMEFELEAPDQNESFDSDTQFSSNSLGSPALMATTIDPMAPVADPTEIWSSYDLNQIDRFGRLASTNVVQSPSPRTASQPTASQSEASDSVPIRSKTFYGETYRKKSNVGLMIGGTLLSMLIVGGITYVALYGGIFSNNQQIAQNNGAADGQSETKKAQPEKSPSNSDSSKDSQSPEKPATSATDSGTSEKKDNEPSNPEAPSLPTDSKMKSGDDSAPKKSEPMESDSDSPQTGLPQPDQSSPDTPPADSKKSPPEKMETKEATQPKNSDIAELSRLMTEVRTKLQAEEFADANRLLDKAKSLPVLPDHQPILDRLDQVSKLYQDFWNKVVDACGKLKALDEIKFSDENIVKVVESSEERIVYRALGQRVEKQPRELPIGLAMKIAEKEIDMLSAEGRMIKGAVFAIESATNPDRAAEARSLWQDAKLVGAETDELILYLEDDYDELLVSSITRGKVPSEEDSEAALKKFENKYGDQLKLASRNQKAAAALAEQLLKDVVTLDEAADRHANLEQAIFYGGKAGNVEFVLTALSDFNKWFSINLEQQTLDALSKMNRYRLKPDEKKEIARTAFEYMDRAKAASNPELTLQFAELALAAAKGARDPKFLQNANRELQRVKANQEQQKK